MERHEFWDVMEGRGELPPVARLLGFSLRDVDVDAMTVETGFVARAEFTNPAGDVQGGMLAAMLDDTLGPALVATLGRGQWAPTTDLHVQFLAPARPGLMTGRGRVVRKGSQMAFLAGDLSDERGRVVATATATALIRHPRSAEAVGRERSPSSRQ